MNLLASYLPQDRRRALADNSILPERASGSVLFADISGFTPLAEAVTGALGARRAAEELTHQLNHVYEALIAQIDAFGGSVITFAGDAMTCWFDDAGTNSAHRTLSSALAMQAAMGRFANVQLPDNSFISLGIKIAIVHGTTRRFLIGDPSIRLLDILAGEPVTRIAHGEHIAQRGEIVIDQDSARLLAPVIEIAEWRNTEHGEPFAVVARLKALAARAAEVELPAPEDETLRAWVLPEVYAQYQTGLADFLTELRPVVAVFVRFGGIDLEQDADAPGKFDRFISIPTYVYVTVCRFLSAAGDSRAGSILKAARESLQRRAEKISELALRKSFLENVPEHRALMQAWEGEDQDLMEAWHDFWIAQVGGSAALAGLLFVSVSINLSKILSTPGLPDRAAVPFILLLGILLSCSLLLVPDQSLLAIGIEILLCGLAIWGLVSYLDVKRLHQTEKAYLGYEPPRFVLTQVASLPYIIAGILLVAGNKSGLYWIVPAIIASFIKSFFDAWVLLVEINR